jgi:Na+/H+ antiporter NhaD/arsenite permease-like protein
LIAKVQNQVQNDPLNGFWLVSGAAFCIAPFLTNDGVCLLFVELILDAFEAVKALILSSNVHEQPMSAEDRALMIKSRKMPLETGDAIYFLLTLACSSNIGSALTYTGDNLLKLRSFQQSIYTSIMYIYCANL